jgi:hypothetical protein
MCYRIPANHTLQCAMKLVDRMGGNPHWLYQGASESLGLSETGRSVLVSSMPLKGTGEARGNAANRPGLAKRSQGEFTRSGFQPTGKWSPVSRPGLMGQRVVGYTSLPLV